MANQLGMNKTLAIKQLRQSGMSQQAIADALGIARRSNVTAPPSGLRQLRSLLRSRDLRADAYWLRSLRFLRLRLLD